MSYDPYTDEYNPVTKSPKPDLGTGNDGGDFEYGKGGRSIDSNVGGPGVCEGTTEAQYWVEKWVPEGPRGGSDSTEPSDYHPKGDM